MTGMHLLVVTSYRALAIEKNFLPFDDPHAVAVAVEGNARHDVGMEAGEIKVSL